MLLSPLVAQKVGCHDRLLLLTMLFISMYTTSFFAGTSTHVDKDLRTTLMKLDKEHSYNSNIYCFCSLLAIL